MKTRQPTLLEVALRQFRARENDLLRSVISFPSAQSDQINVGQIQATASSASRDALKADANSAISSPAATAYHHQRPPLTAKINSLKA
jgi:hypothetical protein